MRATNQKIHMKLINAYTERGKLKKKEFSYAGNLFKEMNNIYGKLQIENKNLLGNDPSKQVLFQHSKPNFISQEKSNDWDNIVLLNLLGLLIQ